MSENLEVNDTTYMINTTEFPMVVFLRGDEAYFNDFGMNADQVMEVLGIRRSRLNQISGKELRVGRARIDNYVRPVYRKQDVEEYLKWIRPTATHKKSSDLLNEARSKLELQSDRISQQLSSRFETLIQDFNLNFQEQFFDQKKFSKNILILMQKSLHKSLRTLLQRSSFLQSQSLAYWEELKLRFDDINLMRKELEQLKAAIVQISDMSRYSERIVLDVQTQQKQLHEKLDALLVHVEEIRNPVEELPLPIVRLRRQSGFYLSARQEIKNTGMDSVYQANKQGLIRHWRRKKVAIKSPV